MLKAQLSHNGSPRAIRKLVVNLLGSASLVVGLGVGGAVLAGGHLMAADIEATLYPGQSANASVSVTLAALPPTADVLFSFDCTSSMYGVINTAKANAVSLMDSLEATGVDFHYGVASFMDYPGVYGSCGYSNYVDGFGLIPTPDLEKQFGKPPDLPVQSRRIYSQSEGRGSVQLLETHYNSKNVKARVYEKDEILPDLTLKVVFHVLTYQPNELYIDGQRHE